MHSSRIVLLALLALLVNDKPACSYNADKAPVARQGDKSSPNHVRPALLTVQDIHHSNQEGFGLLGMYALCADNSRIPYYITNVFPPSELTQSFLQEHQGQYHSCGLF